MRKMRVMVMATALSLLLAGCEGGPATTQVSGPMESGDTTQGQVESVSVDEGESAAPAPAEGSPEEIIKQIQEDFTLTEQGLLDEQGAVASKTGTTFDGYVANVDAVQAWYDLVVSETEKLGARTIENARQYYRSVVATIDHGDDDALDDALEDFYDLIYDDAFDEYYDVVYDDGFDAMYDAYYDGSIEDGYDTIPYDEWYDQKSDAYEAWFDAKSDVYEAWFDSKSDIYGEWFDVNSGFYGNEFDVDEILRLDDAA